MPIAVLTVCLPAGTHTDQLDRAARRAAAQAAGLRDGHPTAHFATHTRRLKRRALLQPWQDTTAGGPLRLLDLDRMRITARDGSWWRWHIWHRITGGTRPAQPYWMFLDRHHADPTRYPLAKARQHYLAQPRIAAMRAYNALPTRATTLPTGHLEAFQAGSHTYAHLGALAAIPADGLVTLDGRYLTAAADRLADQLSYLEHAARTLTALHRDDQLVALTR